MKGLIPQFLSASRFSLSLSLSLPRSSSGSFFIVKANFTHRMLLRRGVQSCGGEEREGLNG